LRTKKNKKKKMQKTVDRIFEIYIEVLGLKNRIKLRQEKVYVFDF